MSLTPEQLAARKTGLGGSDAAAACGQDPWKTPVELWVDKTDPDYVVHENDAMRFGTLTEPVVRQLYADATGRTVVTPAEMVRCDIPWMFAHLDGVASGNRNVQCKTSRTRIGWGEPGSPDIPLHYLFQVQHEMRVAALEVTDVPVLFGDFEFAIYEVEADREFQELIVEREREFWRAVESRTPPEVRTARDALLRWPRSTPVSIPADDAAQQVAGYLRAVKDAIAALDARKEAAESYLKATMGEADSLDANGIVVATWKSTRAATRFDKELFRAAHPDLYERFLTRGAPSRRFLLKENPCPSTTIQLPSTPPVLARMLPPPTASD